MPADASFQSDQCSAQYKKIVSWQNIGIPQLPAPEAQCSLAPRFTGVPDERFVLVGVESVGKKPPSR
jgi:hypothetical protein